MGHRETHAKRKKVLITLDDVYSCVLQRYSPSAVIMMYQEIAQACGNRKFDWKELARKTSTGITNAREYQMLWRHLAYGHPLDDKIEQGAELLDDESDLEVDLEAVPYGSAEDIADAHAAVQVLLASGPHSDVRMINNSAADASSVPYEKQNGCASENAHVAGNSGLHTSSQKLLSQAYRSGDGLDVNASNLPRKKRNPWTEEEDRELIAAVNKCGEGNWANILRGDFNGDRSASQLSQRWAILKKRNKNIGFGGSSINGQQLSQAHLATRNALSVALNMSVTLTTSASVSANTVMNSTSAVNPSESLPAAPIPQVPEGPSQTSTLHGASAASLKNRPDAKKPPVPVKPSISSAAMLQAAAVAAGARIATPEDAESLLKAAQAKNAVYIMNGGAGGLKSGTIGPMPSNHLVAPHFTGVGMPGTSLSNNSSAALPNVSKVGPATKPPVAPSMTSERHPSVSKAEASTISKQATVNDGETPRPSSKPVKESDVIEKPHECQQQSKPAEEAPADEIKSSVSAENGGSGSEA